MIGFVIALVTIALWERRRGGQAAWPPELQSFKRVTDAIAIAAGFAAAWAVADVLSYQYFAWQTAAAVGPLAGRALVEPLLRAPTSVR